MSDQGSNYGGGPFDGGQQYPQPGQPQPPHGQWVDPNAGYSQPYAQPSVPFSAGQPTGPAPMPPSRASKKSSPLFPILLAAAVIVAAVFVFLWQKANGDADDAKKVAATAQVQIDDVTKKAATDVAAAKKAADAVKAQDKTSLDAANAALAQAKTDAAKAKTDSDAAIAKAQADAAAAVAAAQAGAGSSSGVQAKLDAANAALAAANAKEAAVANSLAICQGFATSSNDIVPDLNNFVDLAAAINSSDQPGALKAINAINASGFDTNKNTWNTALNDCLNTPKP